MIKEFRRIAAIPPGTEALQTQKVEVMFQIRNAKKELVNNIKRLDEFFLVATISSIYKRGTKAINKITGKPMGGHAIENNIPLKSAYKKNLLLFILYESTKYGFPLYKIKTPAE